LERLKEKIKAERATRKGIAPPSTNIASVKARRAGGSSSSSDEDNDNEALLTVKRKHDWEDEEGAAALPLPYDTKMRKKLKIRVDQPTGEGKRIIFQANDELDDGGSTRSTDSRVDGDEGEEFLNVQNLDVVKAQNEEYIKRVQERLNAVKGEERRG